MIIIIRLCCYWKSGNLQSHFVHMSCGGSPQFSFHTCTTQREILCSDVFTTTTNPPQDSDEGWVSRQTQDLTHEFRCKNHMTLFTAHQRSPFSHIGYSGLSVDFPLGGQVGKVHRKSGGPHLDICVHTYKSSEETVEDLWSSVNLSESSYRLTCCI